MECHIKRGGVICPGCGVWVADCEVCPCVANVMHDRSQLKADTNKPEKASNC